MKPVDLLAALVALAAEAGIQVRAARPDEPILESALCKLRGAWWLVLLCLEWQVCDKTDVAM